MADLRAVLTDYYQQHGELTPEIVVEEARPETAPLHHRFEWDDAIAGEAYRREQASELIRSVNITFAVTPKGERKTVRAFYSVHQAGSVDKRGYAPTENLLEDPLATKILLKELEREVIDLKRKYGHLEQFAQIVRATVQDP